MQKNKSEFNYAVKRLIALSLVTAVGLGNVPLQTRAQSSEENSSHSESYSSNEAYGEQSSNVTLAHNNSNEQQQLSSSDDYERENDSLNNEIAPPGSTRNRMSPGFRRLTSYMRHISELISRAVRPCSSGVFASHERLTTMLSLLSSFFGG